MIAYAFGRILQTLLVLLVISFIAFLLVATLGDPLGLLLPPEASLAERQELIMRLGLNEPLPSRFLHFLAGMLQGDFGLSYRTQEGVGAMIAARLPATIELAFASLLVTLAIGVPLGILCGVRPSSPLAKSVMLVSIAGITLPNFVVGVLLIAVFSVQLGWFPSFGRGETVELGGWTTGLLTLSGWQAIILPAITLAAFQVTFVIRMLRTQLLEVGQSEHIRFARARGLSERQVWLSYAMRNALLPTITMLALQLGNVIAFSVVTEGVFAWPGLGSLFLQSVQSADIPVIAIYLIFVGAVFMIINLAVELSYPLLDPRLRRGRA
ncbi:ABC transporter permease [Aurantimonas sp. VKM B-3413]|uniref:ABC transporter permease n=1 Tax=Aurantimonas sp. VKM B-3413 TaxID=2779401 RepID=UPI001E586408|nr:ABC transporter permease [Aurantimonas sp. VKM B-3413]MCB8836223.1 ABC transporter permease [Aurantimonas sp. VKM B-3413]